MSGYTLRETWYGLKSTATDRAEEHIKLTCAMADENMPLPEAVQFYTASVIADLLALADEHGADIEMIIAEARTELNAAN